MLIFSKNAEDDIFKARDYYLNIDIEIAKKFTLDVEKSVNLIEKFPDLGSNRYVTYSKSFDLKFSILKSFPFMIFYHKMKDDINIDRVLHMNMDLPHHLYF